MLWVFVCFCVVVVVLFQYLIVYVCFCLVVFVSYFLSLFFSVVVFVFVCMCVVLFCFYGGGRIFLFVFCCFY